MNLPEKKLSIRRRNGLGQALGIFTGDGFEEQDDPKREPEVEWPQRQGHSQEPVGNSRQREGFKNGRAWGWVNIFSTARASNKHWDLLDLASRQDRGLEEGSRKQKRVNLGNHESRVT